MPSPYFCPTCKSNRMRFTLIEQQPRYVRLDPRTGEVVAELAETELDAFHKPYRGNRFLVQCGLCGTTESEERFVKMALHAQGAGGLPQGSAR